MARTAKKVPSKARKPKKTRKHSHLKRALKTGQTYDKILTGQSNASGSGSNSLNDWMTKVPGKSKIDELELQLQESTRANNILQQEVDALKEVNRDLRKAIPEKPIPSIPSPKEAEDKERLRILEARLEKLKKNVQYWLDNANDSEKAYGYAQGFTTAVAVMEGNTPQEIKMPKTFTNEEHGIGIRQNNLEPEKIVRNFIDSISTRSDIYPELLPMLFESLMEPLKDDAEHYKKMSDKATRRFNEAIENIKDKLI